MVNRYHFIFKLTLNCNEENNKNYQNKLFYYILRIYFLYKIHEITAATKLLHRTWPIDSCIAAVSIIVKIIIMTHENRTKYMQQKRSEERIKGKRGRKGGE